MGDVRLQAGLILLVLAANAAAVSLGVSPSNIEFRDVLKGGYAEGTATISTSSPEPVEISLSVGGEARDWITLGETTFTLEPNSRHGVKVMVEPPADAPNGAYKASVTAKTRPPAEGQQVMGAIIITAVEMQATISVTGDQIIDYEVPSVQVKDTEEGQPIEFNIRVDNRGNTRITPQIRVDIMDEASTIKSLDHGETEILPTTSENILLKVDNDLPIGQYRAKVTVSAEGEQTQETVGFEVLERGSLRLQGQLITIRTDKVWATVGDVVELTAVFKNTGQLVAPAVFKGKVYLDDDIVDVIEGDEIDVPVGETADLTTYYKPGQPGKYKIVGWVYYSKKTTKEGFVIVNVQDTTETTQPPATEEKEGDSTPLYAVIAVLAVVVVILLFRRK